MIRRETSRAQISLGSASAKYTSEEILDKFSRPPSSPIGFVTIDVGRVTTKRRDTRDEHARGQKEVTFRR